jgi:hypothetical protein
MMASLPRASPHTATRVEGPEPNLQEAGPTGEAAKIPHGVHLRFIGPKLPCCEGPPPYRDGRSSIGKPGLP